MSTVSHDAQSSDRTQSRRGRVTRFQIACDCGEVLRGKRRRGAQALRCPHCGAPVFVLPLDRVPLGPKRRRAPWARRTWRRLRRRAWRATRNLVRVRRPHLTWPRWLTPTRIIAAAVCVVLVGTVWIQWQRSSRASLTEAVRQHRESAEAAVQQGTLRDAHEHYQQAVKAMARLAEPYPGAERIVRRAREVALMAQLCPETLEKALATCFQQPDPGAYFADHYRGASVVLDCLALPARPGVFENDALVLTYRVVLPKHDLVRLRVGHVDLPDLLPLRGPKRVVLGARLDRLEVSPDGKQLWLDPSGMQPVTDVALLEACGWRPPPDTVKVVAAQQALQEAQP